MRIESLRHYQRPRGAGRFDDLPPDQRAVAESHYERLCSRWGNDLPPWRRAILAGRAKDLVLRPRDAAWARELRKGRRRQPTSPVVSPSAPPQPTPRPGVAPLRRKTRAFRATQVASASTPSKVASSAPGARLASSSAAPSTLTPPSPHAVRLDIRGLTASGRDGADTAQKILHDLELRAFGDSPHFSIAVPGTDLPPGWVWRLIVVPVS